MIIQSLLDTDLYKFTMMQVVLHHFPGAHVEYRFNCRTRGIDLAPYVDEIREEIAYLCLLRVRENELEYLRGHALHQERLRRLPRPVPAQHQVDPASAQPGGERRHQHRHQGPVAAHDPVRDPGARDRQRGLLPQHAAAADFDEGRRRLREKIALVRDNPALGRLPHRRLRHAPALLAPVARRSAADAEEGTAARTSPAPAT